MATIAFDGKVLNERGTTAALFDYADGAETQLGHRSIVFHQTGTADFSPRMVDLFSRRFEPIGYSDLKDRKRKVKASGAEMLYSFTFGAETELLVPGVKSALHAPFQHCRPYGDNYAYISEWMTDHLTQGRQPWVPHIVNLPPSDGNFRKDWGFSDELVVLGRHGGWDQFDLPFVKGAVAEALERRRDLAFAFLNTEPFIRHERVRFVDPVYDLVAKSNFIASCDGMLHGRKAGEGFGLAPAEFLAQDKPVICWEGGKDRNHLRMVPDHSLVYRSARDLVRILCDFQPDPGTGRYHAATLGFTTEAVMKRFSEVFIDPPAGGGHVEPTPWAYQVKSRLQSRAIVLRGRLWRDGGVRQVAAMKRERLAGKG